MSDRYSISKKDKEFVYVKQYAVTKLQGEKCVALKLENRLPYPVCGVTISVCELDRSRKVISKSEIELRDIHISVGGVFSPDTGIVISDRCADVNVSVVCAYANGCIYRCENGRVTVSYERQTEWIYSGSDDEQSKNKYVSKKTVRSPMLFVLAIIAVLIMLAAAAYPAIKALDKEEKSYYVYISEKEGYASLSMSDSLQITFWAV